MTVTYPDDVADAFPEPPVSFTDDESRDIEVRAAGPDEREALVEMYLDFAPEDRAQGIPPLQEAGIRDWLDTIVDPEGYSVVAWHGEDPVGHAVLVPAGDGAYELAIFVLQDYQGARIGTKLLRALLGLAQADGVTRVWLTVERWNDPAIRLYHKVGFEECDTESYELEMSIRLGED